MICLLPICLYNYPARKPTSANRFFIVSFARPTIKIVAKD